MHPRLVKRDNQLNARSSRSPQKSIVLSAFTSTYRTRPEDMKHLATSQICADLPVEIWDLILAKTDPYACLVFGRDDIIPKIEGLDARKWLLRAIVKGHLGLVCALNRQNSDGRKTFTAIRKRQWRDPENAMDLAAKHGHVHIVRWLHENRKEGCTRYAMDMAAKFGHLEVVKWLHANRNEGCTQYGMDQAAENGHLEVIKWLHEKRTESCSYYAMSGGRRGRAPGRPVAVQKPDGGVH